MVAQEPPRLLAAGMGDTLAALVRGQHLC